MLIVAVGHGGFSSDPFTCSVNAEDVDHEDMEDVLACILQEQDLPEDSVDELMVIEGEKVIAHYTLE